MLLNKRIPLKYILGKIKYELAFVLTYGIAFEIIHHNMSINYISIPMTVPTILGTIISLLLAFRSNQAYDRWWEARIIWGAIVNDSRTLARQIQSFLDNNGLDTEDIRLMQQRVIYRQIAWCYALGRGLRRENPLPHIDKYISEDEINYVAEFDNAHVAILDMQAKDLREAYKQGWVNEYQQIEIDKTLTRLCDSMGKCERIKNTIFPSTYSLYIHLALHFFVLLLPFGLVDLFGLIMTPVLVVVAACFFLIEKMAIHLQDPFENKPTDTPVLAISRNIERDLKQLLRDNRVPERYQPDHFYIL